MHDVVNHMHEGSPVILRIMRGDEDVRMYRFPNEREAENFLVEQRGGPCFYALVAGVYIIEEGWLGDALGR